MLEARRDRGLTDEPRMWHLARAEHLLDRHDATDPQVAHLHDATQTTARELSDELIARRIDRRLIDGPHGNRPRLVGSLGRRERGPSRSVLRGVALRDLAIVLCLRSPRGG